MLDRDLDFEDRESKVYGVVTAIVTNNKDEEGLGRVKVTFPWLAENDESHWARIATLMAGNGRGTYFLPEIGDEVLVAFENGDINFPYVIGALWNGKDKVHETNSDGKNNLRVIKSRSGHKVIFDDTKEEEKITVIDYTKNRKVVIDSKKKQIDIYNSDGKVNIYAGSDINIETKANLNIKVAGDLNCKVSGNISAKSSSNISFKSGASTKVEAGSSMKLKSNGVNTIRGSLIKLN